MVSLAVLVWAVAFVRRKHGGAVLIALSIALFLVGGGFVSLLTGVMAGVAGTRIDAPLTWWRAHLSPRVWRLLAVLWPWSLIALLLEAGEWIIGYFFNDFMMRLTPILTIITPLLLVLIVLSGFARDIQRRPTSHQTLQTISTA